MAKRFIDTKIWDKAWFRKLSTKNKLVWIYLLGKCDHAGIWDADWELAEFIIGETITYDELPDVIKDKMEYIEGEDQYFIPSFIDFQYGELKEHSKPHMSVIKRLNDKGLLRVSNKIDTIKDKEKEKEQYKVKDKVKVKDKKKDKEAEFSRKSFIIAQEIGVSDDMYKDFVLYWTESNEGGLKMKFEMQKTFDIRRRLQRWKNNDFGNKPNKLKQKESKFKKLSTGLYKAYCSKCGNDLLPNYYQLKESSHCCGVEMQPEKPEIEKHDVPIDLDIIKNLASKMKMG